MKSKNRRSSSFSPDEVRNMFSLRAEEVSYADIGAAFNTSMYVARDIVLQKQRKDVYVPKELIDKVNTLKNRCIKSVVTKENKANSAKLARLIDRATYKNTKVSEPETIPLDLSADQPPTACMFRDIAGLDSAIPVKKTASPALDDMMRRCEDQQYTPEPKLENKISSALLNYITACRLAEEAASKCREFGITTSTLSSMLWDIAGITARISFREDGAGAVIKRHEEVK